MEHRLLALVRRATDTRPDADLLASVRDDPGAFAELVARHGPVVWGVCRRMLDHADAEDAFQATFVALLRSSIRDKMALAAWLHAVAVRVSLAVRRGAGRRRARERAAAIPQMIPPREPDDSADTMAVVHQEVAALPDADRSAFVLCVLEGLTQAEAANRLGRTPGAVAGQVARAKKRLVTRLTSRGVVPGLAALGMSSVADAVPPGLVERVLDQRGAAVPVAVLRLAKGVTGMSLSSTRIILTAAVAIGALLVVSGLRLIAADPDDKPPATETKPAPVVAQKAEGGRTWKGHITEKGTGKPIAGAEVVVTISADEDKTRNEPKLLRKLPQKTGPDGAYEFAVTPEEAARRRLYIELNVTSEGHTGYYGGYGYSLILKNETLGVRPFYERVELWPGKAIEGAVKTPGGEPAVGVRVIAYTSPTFGKFSSESRFPETKTDARGRFRLVIHAEGKAVFWILPQDHAPEVHGIPKGRRGDLGNFTLSNGERLAGKLLDTQGKPVGGVYVEASRETKEGQDDVVPGNVADLIRRAAVTAADGSFEFRPLPAGTYRVEPTEEGWDPGTRDQTQEPVKKPLPAVFLARTVTLEKGKPTAALEIRAIPHVVVEAQWLNSNGKKSSGASISLCGSLGEEFWCASCDSTPEGAYRLLAPKGLKDASLSLIYDPDSAVQFRVRKGAPLQFDRELQLGTLDHDVKGIEIIRHAAPTIVITATTRDGKPVKNLLPSVKYTDPDYRGSTLTYKGKSRTHVPFEDLEDGKVRTIQLVPDREVLLTVQADGFKPASRKMTLPEGKTEEVKFVLEPK